MFETRLCYAILHYIQHISTWNIGFSFIASLNVCCFLLNGGFKDKIGVFILGNECLWKMFLGFSRLLDVTYYLSIKSLVKQILQLTTLIGIGDSSKPVVLDWKSVKYMWLKFVKKSAVFQFKHFGFSFNLRWHNWASQLLQNECLMSINC